MNIKIGNYNLAGEAWNEKISEFLPNTSRDVTVQKHFRAQYPKLRYSGNELTTIQCKVARLHKNYAAARQFQLDHPSAVPISGVVTIDDTLEGGIVKRTYLQAIVQAFSPEMIGITTITSYQIVGTKLGIPTKVNALARLSALSLPSSGTSTSGSSVDSFDVVATRAELKALTSSDSRQIVFVTNPEPGVQRCYSYAHGDHAADDDVSIIAPTDNGGRYYQFNP